ncbi:BZ3500_MvSof-1268-A1-R1_Chr1-3g02032 [Microbotryum saponariae]|uniref:BZ3500_MvSof-1268-A1-R1_Chr1-3g02032 protein n=1 Tax=Microbotryum saponariae TaxID=289078 RepID=A0A2X0KG10_9BASI|nr:BZ3500_MvSof-1268-A1-R1_Chr1-3g02032 [Microbotryum saponariae]SCZ95203.1 BZ3501_MvSof-1269-A2-R1_Chr1-3g01634 [Microbotryum saponariae]
MRYSRSELEPIIDELRLVIASVIKNEEFEWDLLDEQDERDWENALGGEDAYGSSMNVSATRDGGSDGPPHDDVDLVLPEYSLCLAPEAHLRIQHASPLSSNFKPTLHAPSVSRTDHDRLSRELTSRLDELNRQGEEYPVFNLFTSLRESLALNPLTEPTRPSRPGQGVDGHHEDKCIAIKELRSKCTLLWSHHLLATGKRKKIVQWSTELGLWGISKPGYPGVIIVEGLEADADEFVHRIKQLNWKALQVRCEHVSDILPTPPPEVSAPGRHEWLLRHHASLAPVLTDEIRVKEVAGMNEVAELMKQAGLEHVFKSALKL